MQSSNACNLGVGSTLHYDKTQKDGIIKYFGYSNRILAVLFLK
jgi:hypothetical protein